MSKRTRLLVALTVMSIVAAASTAYGLAFSRSSTQAQSSDRFSALTLLPTTGQLPPDLKAFIARAAPVLGVDASTLEAQVRLLRSDLGPHNVTIYGFIDPTGRPCFFGSQNDGGSCATLPNVNPAGLHWSVGGGMPGEPARLEALADDAIDAVSLTADGVDVPVSLENNIAYATFPASSSEAVITAHYRDGSTQSQRVDLNG